MKTNVKNQKSTDKFWTDESGTQVPYSRTSESEKLMEKESYRLFKEALKINQELAAYKKTLTDTCQKVYATFMAEKGNDKVGKGNYTWHNFNRTIKIEVSINERIEFDDLTITACKDKLDEFLKETVQSTDDAIKAMIMDAFNNTKGRLDTKKVMNLLRYKSKIKHAFYQEAMELLESSIRRPDSKAYFRVWAMDDNGSYQLIDLNFSSI